MIKELDSESAFEGYYARSFGIVHSTLTELGCTYEEACDIAQEAFLRAYTHWPTEPPVVNFVVKIAHNVWVSSVRRKRPVNFSSIEDANGELPLQHPGSTLRPTESTVIYNQVIDKAQAVLNTLNPNQSRAIDLQMQGYSLKEIGDIEEVPADRVKGRIHLGVTYLRGALKGESVEDLPA